MIKEFFLDKIEYDLACNLTWIKSLEDNENKLDSYVLKSMSHVINVHHIWNSRLLNKSPESDLWDLLPLSYLRKFAEQNTIESKDYLEKYELGEKVNYHSSEGVKYSRSDIDILYHILNHSNYHRGQIALRLKELEIKPPSLNFIVYR